jgi:hypothetical protein
MDQHQEDVPGCDHLELRRVLLVDVVHLLEPVHLGSKPEKGP